MFIANTAMTRKDLERIAYVLDWYEGTDGCEREQPADQMYYILTEIYNNEAQKINNRIHGHEMQRV